MSDEEEEEDDDKYIGFGHKIVLGQLTFIKVVILGGHGGSGGWSGSC